MVPSAMHAEEMRRYLSDATGRPVRLRMNANLHSMISVRRDGTGPGLHVSLNRIFLDADSAVIAALAKFITRPSAEDRRLIRHFINSSSERIAAVALSQPRKRRIETGRTRGEHVNLQPRADDLNARYFANELKFRIIWGRGRQGEKRRQRHITLGTWNDRQRVIRIHPILDNPSVPLFFLDFVIYHEMVHIAVPTVVAQSGAAIHHSAEFRARERRFEHFQAAVTWEREWLDRLLRSWSGGKPLPVSACRADF
ncbi:hypothetical protein IT570_01230 [Candidatus Sumerlaeota bacterium]|nr:hypothetical protein [Candidatus Sumerlaeota bacterium]